MAERSINRLTLTVRSPPTVTDTVSDTGTVQPQLQSADSPDPEQRGAVNARAGAEGVDPHKRARRGGQVRGNVTLWTRRRQVGGHLGCSPGHRFTWRADQKRDNSGEDGKWGTGDRQCGNGGRDEGRTRTDRCEERLSLLSWFVIHSFYLVVRNIRTAQKDAKMGGES